MKMNFSLFKKNYKKFSLLIILEFLFLFLVVLILMFSSLKLIENYNVFSSTASIINPDEFSNAEDEKLIDLQSSLNIMNNSLENILKIYGILIFVLFLLIGLFKGIEWMISYNIIEKKKFNWKYLLKFYLLLLTWIIIFGLLYYIINLFFKNGYNLLLVLFLFYCFSSISFILLLRENKIFESIKKSFKLLFSKAILIFLFIIFIFGISVFILNFLISLNFLSLIISIFSLLFLLLLISWSRIFILLNLKEI